MHESEKKLTTLYIRGCNSSANLNELWDRDDIIRLGIDSAPLVSAPFVSALLVSAPFVSAPLDSAPLDIAPIDSWATLEFVCGGLGTL
jgi:hypothetical protein